MIRTLALLALALAPLCSTHAQILMRMTHGAAEQSTEAPAGVEIANLANNIATSNGFSTGSLTWAAGSRGVACVASSADGAGLGGITAHTVSGGGVTWTEIGFVAYGLRRGVSVLVSDTQPTSGALTITATTADT